MKKFVLNTRKVLLFGTNNFVHGIPFTAISVAFVLKKELQIGIVYNPIMHEMYTARLSWLNSTKKQQITNIAIFIFRPITNPKTAQQIKEKFFFLTSAFPSQVSTYVDLIIHCSMDGEFNNKELSIILSEIVELILFFRIKWIV